MFPVSDPGDPKRPDPDPHHCWLVLFLDLTGIVSRSNWLQGSEDIHDKEPVSPEVLYPLLLLYLRLHQNLTNKPTMLQQKEVGSYFTTSNDEVTYKSAIKCIHKKTVVATLSSYPPNKVLGAAPPDINPEEVYLPPEEIKIITVPTPISL